MNQQHTEAIVLHRFNFGEADRIVTVLTPDVGKLRLMAKGVRRVKSKLAGGIELFSISEITYSRGRGEIGQLISARLKTHYGQIVTNMDRVQLGYELLKQLHTVTEDHTEEMYFNLLVQALSALDSVETPLIVTQAWFTCQLLRLAGLTPLLTRDAGGSALHAGSRYRFDYDAMAFAPSERGPYQANQIKIMRLLCAQVTLRSFMRVVDVEAQLSQVVPLIQMMAKLYLLKPER